MSNPKKEHPNTEEIFVMMELISGKKILRINIETGINENTLLSQKAKGFRKMKFANMQDLMKYAFEFDLLRTTWCTGTAPKRALWQAPE